MSARPPARPPSSLPLARLLQAGVVVGAGLLLAGGLLAVYRGELHTGGAGNSVIEAGVLVLIFTPALRVVASGVILGRPVQREARDWVAVVCAVAVLTLLGLAFALDLGASKGEATSPAAIEP